MSQTILNIVLNNSEIESFNIDSLTPIMLTKKYKNEITSKYGVINTDIEVRSNCEAVHECARVDSVVTPPTVKESDYIEPKQNDTLFWCIYIIAHGYNDYLQISRNYGVKELEEKQKIFEFIKTNTSKIKNTNYKITNVAIQEMSSEFITVQKETSILCLIAMTVYYNINILIVNSNDNGIIEFWSNKEQIPSISSTESSRETSASAYVSLQIPSLTLQTTSVPDPDSAMTYVLYKNKFGKYKLMLENVSTSKMYELKDKYIVLDSYIKPLKTISNYKVEQLEHMAKKLGVFDVNKKYKKSDLYDLVNDSLQSS